MLNRKPIAVLFVVLGGGLWPLVAFAAESAERPAAGQTPSMTEQGTDVAELEARISALSSQLEQLEGEKRAQEATIRRMRIREQLLPAGIARSSAPIDAESLPHADESGIGSFGGSVDASWFRLRRRSDFASR